MSPSEVEKVAYAFETELHFECHWFMQAWRELEALNLQGNAPMLANTLLFNLSAWSIVDRLLNHAVRIDRMLNPQNYASKDSKESRAARESLSGKARKALPPDVFAEGDLKAIRDSIEHANERIPAFIAGRDIDRLQPFLIGPMAKKSPAGVVNFLRGFDPFTGVCIVFGREADLNRIQQSVQKLLMALPPLRVHSKLFLPPDVGADQKPDLLREDAIGHVHPDESHPSAPND
jgi:hypothetical protein